MTACPLSRRFSLDADRSRIFDAMPQQQTVVSYIVNRRSFVAVEGFVTTETISIAGRTLRPTPVFDTYWRFASERQHIYGARTRGESGPWTTDPILSRFRFTNCYRATDRVSQFLIQRVSYEGDQSPVEIVFRTLLFKLFNRIETWELLESEIGRLAWNTFDLEEYDGVLSDAFASGRRLYSAAYVIPPPAFGASRKHTNHLRLLQFMMTDGVRSDSLTLTTWRRHSQFFALTLRWVISWHSKCSST